MRVALGTFAREEVEARFGDDIAAGVRAALEHYVRRLTSSPAPPAFPRFRREELDGTTRADLELPVEARIRRTLAREARRAGVPVEQLAAHAVLDCLADLDRAATGRVVRQSCGSRQRRRASFCV